MTWEQFKREYKRRLKTRWGITLTKPMCKKAFEPILSDINDSKSISEGWKLISELSRSEIETLCYQFMYNKPLEIED